MSPPAPRVVTSAVPDATPDSSRMLLSPPELSDSRAQQHLPNSTMEFGCSTEMTTNPPAPGSTETAEAQLMPRIRRDFSRKLELLNHENDDNEEIYGCVFEQCFPHLQTCLNGRFGITEDAEERQFLEIRCVTEFGSCATTCFNRYRTFNNI
ncbi:SOSS complex subunit C isoform X3 [Hemiscyllium ocellatum]|uniref:SOSS complex subunit C isoform X3 n=1 Tax=Hemiscyllium ocellatum TaxID=170820 RepID=UPI002966B13C|nr:SOSS complex subunit C isoform X3 [Hemiscyllium ocellatum]